MRADGSPNPDDFTHEDAIGQPMETIYPETGGPRGRRWFLAVQVRAGWDSIQWRDWPRRYRQEGCLGKGIGTDDDEASVGTCVAARPLIRDRPIL